MSDTPMMIPGDDLVREARSLASAFLEGRALLPGFTVAAVLRRLADEVERLRNPEPSR
jgi:hypothetical protein